MASAALIVAFSAAALATDTAAAAAADTSVGDGPAGFWYGTDSMTMAVGGAAPFAEPVIGGAYGGYLGMVGNWARWRGCPGTQVVWSAANSAQANANYGRDKTGIGTGGYWFMGGPGVDPHYNGTSAEAYRWGRVQAIRALADVRFLKVTYPVLFMDIELPGTAPSYTPASDNGWNHVYTTSCSGRVKQNWVPAALDRADFDGFFDYVTTNSGYLPGVYSAPDVWSSIFGSSAPGSYGYIPNTDEWTYESFTRSLASPPSGWCLRGTSTCARFFGGVSSSSRHALIWQWSGGGGATNGYGDFDQIDAARQR